LQRIGVKFFVHNGDDVALAEFVPVFHRWIRDGAVEGLLIDVADYQHVHHGPGVMLIAHEGNYGIDVGGGRMGLMYVQKRPLEGGLSQRLASVCRTTLRACAELEQAPELNGRIEFSGAEMLALANDRFVAPNTEATMAAFEPVLTKLLGDLYGAPCSVAREADRRERFAVSVRAPVPVTVRALLDRLPA